MPSAAASLDETTPDSVRRKAFGFLPPVLEIWIERRRARHELANLHDDQLRDAGLERRAVRAEADKPFWKP